MVESGTWREINKEYPENNPPYDVDILVYSARKRKIGIGYCWVSKDELIRWCVNGCSGGNIGKGITHWMPLPEEP